MRVDVPRSVRPADRSPSPGSGEVLLGDGSRLHDGHGVRKLQVECPYQELTLCSRKRALRGHTGGPGVSNARNVSRNKKPTSVRESVFKTVEAFAVPRADVASTLQLLVRQVGPAARRRCRFASLGIGIEFRHSRFLRRSTAVRSTKRGKVTGFGSKPKALTRLRRRRQVFRGRSNRIFFPIVYLFIWAPP